MKDSVILLLFFTILLIVLFSFKNEKLDTWGTMYHPCTDSIDWGFKYTTGPCPKMIN